MKGMIPCCVVLALMAGATWPQTFRLFIVLTAALFIWRSYRALRKRLRRRRIDISFLVRGEDQQVINLDDAILPYTEAATASFYR